MEKYLQTLPNCSPVRVFKGHSGRWTTAANRRKKIIRRNRPGTKGFMLIPFPIVVMEMKMTDLPGQSCQPFRGGLDGICIYMAHIHTGCKIWAVRFIEDLRHNLPIKIQHIFQMYRYGSITLFQKLLPKLCCLVRPSYLVAGIRIKSAVKNNSFSVKILSAGVCLTKSGHGRLPDQRIKAPRIQIQKGPMNRDRPPGQI